MSLRGTTGGGGDTFLGGRVAHSYSWMNASTPSVLRIGDRTFDSNLFLSPIAGFYDLPFRLSIRPLGGLGLAYTELVNPKGLLRQTARSMQIVESCPEDRPWAVQLYGTEEDGLDIGAKWAADHGAALVDINMGCPVPKVAGKGGGSGLLRSCPNAVRLAEKVVNASPVPVTVKTRLGWEMGNLVTPRLVQDLEDVGVAALTIHGRYGEQRFKGSVDLEGIRAVAQAARTIPVIGNGDIRSADDAKRMIEVTGCAGVMIGRWAMADNWIFRDTRSLLETGDVPPPPTRAQRVHKMIDHFEHARRHLGDRRAVVNFRKYMTWYGKQISPCPTLRRGIPLCRDVDEWYGLVHAFLAEIQAERESPEALGRRAGVEASPASLG
ncbi:tRNA-dihydrouridine synthase C [Planctomycetes bacterium Pan216]|uniref:tRNA-dihydrouridine synthase n=1 Tax=Kolteria novifilia TaxID=2527975 RepID=A0A518AZM6_9BACT|nr:tRNA-dihydrouridine synthase C [Planctomycetes bacterium Pan216]